MAERSGLGAQVGIAPEETYGTYKAPTRYLPFTSENLGLQKEYARSQGLRAGRLSQAQNLHIGTTRTTSGDLSLELLNQGMGALFNLLHGEAVSPAKEGETTAYKQTHKVGLSSPYGKGLTVQVGRPGTAGTVHPFSYLGCKIMALSISIESNGIASMSVTVDGQDEVTGEALGEATYDADAIPFPFNQWALKLAGSSAGNCRSLTINISVPQATDRYHLGNSGKKDQPIANELVAVTADATLEFASLTDHERFKKETVVKLEAIATGDEIGSTGIDFSCGLTLNAAKQVSSGPAVQGPDIVTADVSFEALDNGTAAPLEIVYVSSDSAL